MIPTDGLSCHPLPSCRWQGSCLSRPGFQRHHLIPIAILARAQMADMFVQLHPTGFALRRFDQNGLHLPSRESLAAVTGHALHRGPHVGYSDVVAARVETIRATFEQSVPVDRRHAAMVAVMRLQTLQAATRRALTDRHGLGFWLNRRDPMKLFADRSYLDDAIDRIYNQQNPASEPFLPDPKKEKRR